MLPPGAVIYEDIWGSIARANTIYGRLRALIGKGRVPAVARKRLSNADTEMQRAATVVMRTRVRGDLQLREEISRRMLEATRCRQGLRIAAAQLANLERWEPSLPTLEGILDEYAGRRSEPQPPSSQGRILLRALLYLCIGAGALLGLLAIVAPPFAPVSGLLLMQMIPPVVVMAALRLLMAPGPDGRAWQILEAVLSIAVTFVALGIIVAGR